MEKITMEIIGYAPDYDSSIEDDIYGFDGTFEGITHQEDVPTSDHKYCENLVLKKTNLTRGVVEFLGKD